MTPPSPGTAQVLRDTAALAAALAGHGVRVADGLVRGHRFVDAVPVPAASVVRAGVSAEVLDGLLKLASWYSPAWHALGSERAADEAAAVCALVGPGGMSRLLLPDLYECGWAAGLVMDGTVLPGEQASPVAAARFVKAVVAYGRGHHALHGRWPSSPAAAGVATGVLDAGGRPEHAWRWAQACRDDDPVSWQVQAWRKARPAGRSEAWWARRAVVWASAGVGPAEAGRLEALPPGVPGRPSEEDLEMLAALRRG